MPTVDSLFGGDTAPTEVEDRVALVHNAMYDHIREREVQFCLFIATRSCSRSTPTGTASRCGPRSAWNCSTLRSTP